MIPIDVHLAGRRAPIRPIFNPNAERAVLGMEFLRWWALEWVPWTGRIALHPHPSLPPSKTAHARRHD
jgi:hypothetical protein